MYCPRCRIETEDTFCESCGGATVASSEVAATAAQSKVPQFIQEDIKREQIKIQAPKVLLKKIIGLAVSGVFAIGILTGYKTLQAQYTPKKTVEKYYNYIVKKDYDEAFKMLIDTDDRFMTKDTFKKAMEEKGIKQYYIKTYNPNEFQQSFEPGNLQNTNLNSIGNMFTVQASSKLYPVEVIENGSKIVFFKDYKINADNFSIKWQIVAPQGAKVLVNGVQPDISNEPNIDNTLSLNDKYKPATVMYQIDKIFQGSYDVTASMDGAEDVKLTGQQAGQKGTIKFNPTADTVKKLQDKAKAFLNLYYSGATQDKYTNLLTSDSDAVSKISGELFRSDFGLSNVTNKLQNLRVISSQLDDADHATIHLKCSVYYEDSSMVSWGGTKQTGTKDMETNFYFQRINGNWLICDVDYIN